MSDPGDPLRFEEISDGLNIFGENVARLRREFEEFTNLSLSDTFKKIRESFKKLPNELEPLFRKIKEELSKSMKGFTDLKMPGGEQTKKAFKSLSKITKSTWKAMGGAFKDIKEATGLLDAFGSASLITRVFDKVIGAYTTYLSNLFWGNVLKGIDFTAITTVITEILGPIFTEIGNIIGDLIEAAPIGVSVGGALGYLIKGPIGALIGGMIGFGIESLYNFLSDIQGTLGEQSKKEFAQQSLFQQYFGGQISKEEYETAMKELEKYNSSLELIAEGFSETAGAFIDAVVGGHYAPELQGGGITLSEGLYHLHDKEIVAPLDPFTKEQSIQKTLLTNILSELINQSSIQRKIYLEKKFNNMFKG